MGDSDASRGHPVTTAQIRLVQPMQQPLAMGQQPAPQGTVLVPTVNSMGQGTTVTAARSNQMVDTRSRSVGKGIDVMSQEDWKIALLGVQLAAAAYGQSLLFP